MCASGTHLSTENENGTTVDLVVFRGLLQGEHKFHLLFCAQHNVNKYDNLESVEHFFCV